MRCPHIICLKIMTSTARIAAVCLHAAKKRSGVFEECVSGQLWPQCKPCLRAAAVLLSGRIHLSQTNGGVKLSLFIYPSSPESSIFQLEAAGKRLWREVCDPDDSSGTTANCGTEIDFENTNSESEKGWIKDLCDQIYDDMYV